MMQRYQHFATLLLILATPIDASYDEKPNVLSLNNATLKAQYEAYLKTNNDGDDVKTVKPIPAIIGGVPALDNEFPWFGRTKLTFFGGSSRVTGSCGASLIYSDIAVSAAHCVVDLLQASYSLVGIEFNLGANQYDGSDGQVFAVEKIIWPSNYTSFNFAGLPENDIIFYKLNATSSEIPVSWNTGSSVINAGDNVSAIGFGLTRGFGEESPILQKVDLVAISDTKCASLFESSGALSETTTCAESPQGEDKSTCNGDSGGPLLTGSKVMYGITSFGYIGCGNTSGYTKTSPFRFYIPKVICDYSANPPSNCVGFEFEDPVDDGCGLFRMSLFCPFSFGGIIGRFLRSLFGL